MPQVDKVELFGRVIGTKSGGTIFSLDLSNSRTGTEMMSGSGVIAGTPSAKTTFQFSSLLDPKFLYISCDQTMTVTITADAGFYSGGKDVQVEGQSIINLPTTLGGDATTLEVTNISATDGQFSWWAVG